MVVVLTALTADAADLSLGALAGYRGWFDEIDGLSMQEHLFEQSLRAELDTALVNRSLAAWNLGFALDHTLTVGPGDRARVLGLRYDTAVELGADSVLPVRLFASRQLTGAEQSLYPGYSVRSNTWGYEAKLAPEGLPRLSTLGLFQRRRTENLDVVRDERTSIVSGNLLHNDNRLLALAEVERRRDEDPITDDRRDVTEADAFLEYRLDPRTSMVGRARSRRYDSLVGGQPYVVDTLTSDASITTRPSRKVSGVTFYRVVDQTLPDQRTGDAAVGTTWTWYPTDELSGVAQVGLGDAWTTDAGGSRSMLGQYLNLSANHTRWRKTGGWQLFAQSGAASLLAGPALGGVQAGAGAGGVLRRAVGPVMVSGGADVARQLDTSAQGLSYLSWGWLAEAQSNPVPGVQLQVQVTEGVVEQQVLELGNSDRLRVTGLVSVRPERQLDLGYGLNLYHDVLDDQRSDGVGHSVTLRAVPTERVQLFGLVQVTSATTSDLAPYQTRRADATVLFHLPIADASARVSRVRSGGPVPPVTQTVVWFELSRDFRWRL
ncbi:MAG: hypothetical protein ABMA64_23190 [Myxococcota bacterium]